MKKKSLLHTSKPHPVRSKVPHFDPLDEVEDKQDTALPGKDHMLAEKPTKPLKKARSPDEAYRPMHR